MERTTADERGKGKEERLKGVVLRFMYYVLCKIKILNHRAGGGAPTGGIAMRLKGNGERKSFTY